MVAHALIIMFHVLKTKLKKLTKDESIITVERGLYMLSCACDAQ